MSHLNVRVNEKYLVWDVNHRVKKLLRDYGRVTSEIDEMRINYTLENELNDAILDRLKRISGVEEIYFDS